MTVLDLEWGPDMHPEMWKSKTLSTGTDLKLDPQQWWRQLQAVITCDWCSKDDELHLMSC